MAKTLSNRARWGLAGLTVLILLPAAALASGSPFLIGVVTRFLIYGLAAVSLDLVIGYGAMVSFGHAMFFGLGGYAVGIIAFHTGAGEPLLSWQGSNAALIVWPLALVACALLAAIVGTLSLKTSGVQFIMITLAFAQMLYYLAVSVRAYGGDDGLSLAGRSAMGAGVDLGNDTHFYYVTLAFLVAAIVLITRMLNARFGHVLQAIKENETRMQAMDKVIDWMTFYNHRRLHSTLGYVSPMQFESEWLARQANS